MTKNNNLIPNNKTPIATVYELKDYEIKKSPLSPAARNKVINKSGSNYLSENKEGYGPMFNFFELFRILLNTSAGPVVETAVRSGGGSPDVSRAVMETGRFIAEHSNEITQIGHHVSEYVRDSASSSSSTTITSSSYVSDYRTL